MSLLVKHAVYGGVRFAEWTAPSEVGLDVTSKLQALINQNAGVLHAGTIILATRSPASRSISARSSIVTGPITTSRV